MTVYKLFASGTTNVDAVASLDIQNRGHIVAIHGTLYAEGMDALNDGAAFEVSFASTSGFSTNDTRASFFGLRVTQQFLTSGGGAQGLASAISGLNIPVEAGERIYVHRVAGGITASGFSCWLYVEDGEMELPARRRRQG